MKKFVYKRTIARIIVVLSILLLATICELTILGFRIVFMENFTSFQLALVANWIAFILLYYLLSRLCSLFLKTKKKIIYIGVAAVVLGGYLFVESRFTYLSLLSDKNVTVKNIDYVTLCLFTQPERFKLTRQNHSKIIKKLIYSLEYLPSPYSMSFGLVDYRVSHMDKLTLHLKDGESVKICLNYSYNEIEDNFHLNRYTLEQVEKIVEGGIGLYHGVYLMPSPQNISLTYNNANAVDIARDSIVGQEVTDFLRKVLLNSSPPNPEWRREEFKRIKKMMDETEYFLVRFDFGNSCKISILRTGYENISKKSDDYGNPVVNVDTIIMIVWKDMDRKFDFCVVDSQESKEWTPLIVFSSLARDSRIVQQVLNILDSYYRVGPTAEIKGFELQKKE